jgi:hypothetical protein
MTKQKQRLLKAKIAAALYHEEGRVPTPEEIRAVFTSVYHTSCAHRAATDCSGNCWVNATENRSKKWTKFAKVLYTAVLGLHFEREVQKKEGQLTIF